MASATQPSFTPALPSALSRQRRKDARPQELLDAALELFVEKGFAAARAEEVAARAGVSKGTLYLYYPSKAELLKAVIRERLSKVIQAGAVEVSQHWGSQSDLLRGVFARWWLRVVDSPASGVFKLVITEVRSFPEIAEFYFNEVVQPGHALIGSVVERGIETGEFRNVDVPAAVHSLLLPMLMLCLHRHSLGACGGGAFDMLGDPRAFVEQHIELVIRGLLRDEPSARAVPLGRRPRRASKPGS